MEKFSIVLSVIGALVAATAGHSRPCLEIVESDGQGRRLVDLDPTARVIHLLRSTESDNMTDELWQWWELLFELPLHRHVHPIGRHCRQAVHERPQFVRAYMRKHLSEFRDAGDFFDQVLKDCSCEMLMEWLEEDLPTTLISLDRLHADSTLLAQRDAFVRSAVEAWRAGRLDVDDVWRNVFDSTVANDLGAFGEHVGNAADARDQARGQLWRTPSLAQLTPATVEADIPRYVLDDNSPLMESVRAGGNEYLGCFPYYDIILKHRPEAFGDLLRDIVRQDRPASELADRIGIVIGHVDWSLLYPAMASAASPVLQSKGRELNIAQLALYQTGLAQCYALDAIVQRSILKWRKLAMQLCFGELHDEDDVVGTFLQLPADSHVSACLLEGLEVGRSVDLCRLDLMLIARLALHPGAPSSPMLAAVQSHRLLSNSLDRTRLNHLGASSMALLGQAARDIPAVGEFFRGVQLDVSIAPQIAADQSIPLPVDIIDRKCRLPELVKSPATVNITTPASEQQSFPFMAALFVFLAIATIAAVITIVVSIVKKRLCCANLSRSTDS